MPVMDQNQEAHLSKIGDPSTESLLRRILERMDELERNMKNAFVGGDYDGHRRAHEQFISDLQAKRDLRKAVTEQVIKGSVWAALIFLGTAVWQHLRTKLGIF